MNDWERINASVHADTTTSEGRRHEIWRWTALARTWLDENGIDIATLTLGDIARFIAEVEPTSGPKNPYQRTSALRKLLEAARAVPARVARRPGTAAARVDLVPARSPLGKALARVLAQAKSEGDRRRFATCLDTFLGWCAGRKIAAVDCWPGDLAIYRRWLLEDRRTSPGE